MKNWGNSFNSNYSAEIGDVVNQKVHSSSFFLDKGLSEFALTNIFLNELSGTYKFNTEDNDLLDVENMFWWNLIFYGRVGIYKIDDQLVVMNISNITWKYNKVVKAEISPAVITFNQSTLNNQTPQEVMVIEGEDLKNLVITFGDITSEYFIIKYGWIIKSTLDLWEKYQASNQMRIKKIAVHTNTKNSSVIKEFENSLNDNSTFINFQSPSIYGDLMNNSQSAMDQNFKIDILPFKNDEYISIADVYRHLKFCKDIIGMDENSSDTKERVVSTELEDGQTNTIQIAESKMRNFRKFSRDMKTNFGVIVEVKKTVQEELPKPENSDQAFNKSNKGVDE